MDIIQKKNLAMEKIMAIPLGDWNNQPREGVAFETNYNGRLISIIVEGISIVIAVDNSLVLYDERVYQLYFKLAFHFSSHKQAVETVLDDICK